MDDPELVDENQIPHNTLVKALESLERANARIKELEGQVAEKQSLYNDLTKALSGLEDGLRSWKHRRLKTAVTVVSLHPPMGSRSRYAKRRVCEKRAAKRVEGNPVM